jgi:hypothetical protein
MAFSRRRKTAEAPGAEAPVDAPAIDQPQALHDALGGQAASMEISQDQLEKLEPSPDGGTEGGEQQRKYAPDPHNYASVAIGPEHDDRVVLSRSHRFKQMQLSFPSKPDDEVLSKLRDAGWKWNGPDRVWTLPIERGYEWRSVKDAELMLRDVGNLIREKKGLEPVSMPNL